jgi:hypothetical protein
MTDYRIYGDWQWSSQCLLHQCGTANEAIGWAEAYTKGGNTGGYNTIEVVTKGKDRDFVVWASQDEGLLFDEY